jgi:hypothetical protein
VEASLQQARRGERQLNTLLMGDNTGKRYLDTLVMGFLADQNQEASYFSKAEDNFQIVYSPVESAREALQDVAGTDKNYDYVDSVCRSIKRCQNYCVELWLIASKDGRDAIASAYKRGNLFFQTVAGCQ